MVQQSLEIYQSQMAGAFNRQVKFRSLGVGGLVLTIRRPIVVNRKAQGKFEYKWDGPYVVTKVFPNGVYELPNHDEQIVYTCVNVNFIRNFFIRSFWRVDLL